MRGEKSGAIEGWPRFSVLLWEIESGAPLVGAAVLDYDLVRSSLLMGVCGTIGGDQTSQKG